MRLKPVFMLFFSGYCVATFAAPNSPQPIDLHAPSEDLPSVEAGVSERGIEEMRDAKSVQITEADLLANPAMLGHALDNAIAAEDFRAVSLLLPVYKKLPENQRDPQLIRYAEALVARNTGNLSLAIARYREMIAENPSLQPVRLQLALALLSDHQDEAARNQLEKLQAENLPDNVRQIVEKSLQTVRDRRSWSFNASGYYRHESNINGAPKQREYRVSQGKWTFPEPKKAHGIHLDASAERRIPIKNGFYGQIEGSVATDWFWDAHDYDDFRVRLGAGAGWQNARWNVSATPFVSRRIYSGKGYSTHLGSDFSASYWFTPQWRLTTSAQYTHKKHDDRVWLDGNQYFAGVNALYLRGAQQYWFAGVNVLNNHTRDKSDSYSRVGASAGWGQEWGLGMSSRLSGSIAQRNYDAPDFFGIKREDTEYGATLSLWNRDLYFFGITPRLTMNWSKTDSNHFYYTNDNFDAYLEFSRSF